MAQKELAVKVDHLTKSFRIPLEASNGIKQKMINLLKGRKGYRDFTPLKDISFEIEKGDFFGIVGRNGSGKSTLLKTIAGIYTPTKGGVQVNGSLVPFIELGVGFNPELTGRENVFLNGALLGFSHDEMEAMYGDIVDFAELGDFMDERLKNYSSGMQVRLAFSIAIRAQGDILLLDEVLAVGDEAFQRKCDDFFDKIKKDKTKTVILVTHAMESVKKYCNKAILIRDGDVKIDGNPNDVANEYTNDNIGADATAANKSRKGDKFGLGLSNDIPKYGITLLSNKLLSSKDDLEFNITYQIASDKIVDTVVIEIDDISRGNVPIIVDAIKNLKQKRGAYTLKYKLPLKNINDGGFRISSSLRNEKKEILAFTSSEKSVDFAIRNDDKVSTYPLLRERGRVISIENA